ncbi:unnamed protein product, partial [Owenia fusiformis]
QSSLMEQIFISNFWTSFSTSRLRACSVHLYHIHYVILVYVHMILSSTTLNFVHCLAIISFKADFEKFGFMRINFERMSERPLSILRGEENDNGGDFIHKVFENTVKGTIDTSNGMEPIENQM